MHARAAGDGERATSAFARVYFDCALGDYAGSAGAELDRGSIVAGSERVLNDNLHARNVFRRPSLRQARPIREPAECGTGRRSRVDRTATRGMRPPKRARSREPRFALYVEQASSRKSEALYFDAVTARALGDSDDFTTTLRQKADEFRLNRGRGSTQRPRFTSCDPERGTHKADEEFRELVRAVPERKLTRTRRLEDRLWAYETTGSPTRARVRESCRNLSEIRLSPSLAYLGPGRARESLKEDALADARGFRLTVVDYLNTYYGRLAARRLAERGVRLR